MHFDVHPALVGQRCEMMVSGVPALRAWHCAKPGTLEPLPGSRCQVLRHEDVHVTNGSRVGVGIQVGYESPCRALEQHVGAVQVVENPDDGVPLSIDGEILRRDPPRGLSEPCCEWGVDALQSV